MPVLLLKEVVGGITNREQRIIMSYKDHRTMGITDDLG